jgi:diguanylate cyclase (GGDEF)-like protein/PAS domain S-box-containing protein
MSLDIRIRSMMRIAAIQRSTAAVVDGVIEGIIQIDRVGRICRFNKAAEDIFGYPESEVLERNVNMLMPSPYREQHDDYIANYVATSEAKIIGIGRVVVGLRKSGETFPMHLGVTEASTPDGKYFIGLVRDLTEEQKMRKRIECWKRLEERYAIRGSQHGPADCSVFYCDLDGFKQINDRHGHAAGDAVLKASTERMKGALFVRDFIARIGGDEFIAVVDGNLGDSEAREVAQRLIDAVSPPVITPEGEHRVGVSIGIAHSRQHEKSVEDLVAAADSAMYVAKRNGKGQAAFG